MGYKRIGKNLSFAASGSQSSPARRDLAVSKSLKNNRSLNPSSLSDLWYASEGSTNMSETFVGDRKMV